jgi:hypothetical protein
MDIYEGARGADYQLTKKFFNGGATLFFVYVPSNTTDQAARKRPGGLYAKVLLSLSYTFDAIEGKKPPTGAEIR